MGNRLLLADDSITIQKVVAIIFANEEFELTVVDNGIAALQKAREVRPDVMLVDALMPGKSGYEVCAEIRRDPELSATPILLLIGAFEPFDEDKARSCGADSSITKPFESQQLIDRVKELLEMGRSSLGMAAPAAAAEPAAPAAQAAPAQAAPPTLEAAAEELWGDLSAFDTMPPAAAPAAPAQTPPAEEFFGVAAPAAAPAQPAPASSAPQPAPAAAPQGPAAAPQPEPIMEVSLEDDLWGAFELEELPQEPAPQGAGLGTAQAQTEFEAEEFFSFEDDGEGIEETGPALELGEEVPEAARQATPEELFSFADVEPEPVAAAAPAVDPFAAAAAQPESFGLPVEEPFSFEPEAEPLAPFVEPVAPVTPPPVQVPVTPAQPVAQPAPAAAQPAPVALSEADLVAALSKVSREVIERIVWEVVPDLAEVLIKEEIRKLRAGSKG